MSTTKPQAISGVYAGAEAAIMTKYPSIACTGLGRMLGQLYGSIPQMKLGFLLFALPSAPLAVLIYGGLKLFGVRYVLTSQSVQVWSSLTNRLHKEVSLNEIDDIQVQQLPGQASYKAADLVLLSSKGASLARLSGITRAEVFRQNILETRDARLLTASSLATIDARHA